MQSGTDGSGETSISSIDTTALSTLSTTTTVRKNCSAFEVLWSNNTCIPKTEALTNLVDIMRDDSSNSSDKVDALIDFLNMTPNLTTKPNQTDSLTPGEIDELIGGLNVETVRNLSTVFLMALPTIHGNDTVLGGSFINTTNNRIVVITNRLDVINSSVIAAAIISNQSVINTKFIRVLILGEPTAYENLDLSNNQSLVSPVIVANVDKRDKESIINISLYFQVLKTHHLHTNGRYSCSFFDTNTSKWSASGCSEPVYNENFRRYECTCNHLTTFALIWLPTTPQEEYLTSQDIASLTFQSLSIVCFIAVIIHSLIVRLLNPVMSLIARDLMPLISSASTAVLFVFYIALSMTVYTRATFSSSTPIPCFLSASILMFITYFLIIFMFCVKTSVGYFNYLRFVHLFPEPSYRKLFVMICISFFISATSTAFAIGFNSKASFTLTQIHGNKLCWFTRDVIYYFLTIPVGIFLLLNLIMFIFVTRRIINHVRRATSPHQSYERMKRCVLVLVSSCVTQGIGWLFGPVLTFVNPTAANVVGWCFIVLNGLEGVWTILLYVIIRSQCLDESKRMTASKQRIKKTSSKSVKTATRRTGKSLSER